MIIYLDKYYCGDGNNIFVYLSKKIIIIKNNLLDRIITINYYIKLYNIFYSTYMSQ